MDANEVPLPPPFTLHFSTDLIAYVHRATSLAGFPTCTMILDDENTTIPIAPQLIDVVDVLHDGRHSTVYVGRCQDSTEVALKFTTREDVLEEAGSYDYLVELQGKVVPKFCGVLYGNDSRGNDILCLMMERFGNRLDQPFHKLPTVEKAKILNKLVKIHDCGLHHLDFAERNVLFDGNDYRIADLRYVSDCDGSCSWTYDFEEHVGQDDSESMDPSMRCSEIRSEAMTMLFWHDAKLRLADLFWVSKSEDLPPQHVIDRLDVRTGIALHTVYYTEDRRLLILRFFRLIQQKLKNGEPLERLEREQMRIMYDIQKEWHKER
ncbi:hypothetical protein BXZ70DRAFT_923133 [Cristinia sonorae]|uniref:Uncharacterized protein n=1 Tax=Cristinia sonorae TaxID=1940300 RepID=A0A8K0UTR5_9AGAR|nr:hypothetical protein BXZ70DRAFT_923133 [Cristinia sonorae]